MAEFVALESLAAKQNQSVDAVLTEVSTATVKAALPPTK